MRGSLHQGLLHQGLLHHGPFQQSLFPFALGVWVASAMFFVHPVTASGAYMQGTPDDAQRTVWAGVYSEAQAERGQALYTESCSVCHAPDLRGSNTSPSLVGQSFTFLWGGSILGVLFKRIQERMPPVRPGTLPAQTYRDILAFIMNKNSYPSGEQELKDDDLDYILISAKPEAGR